jgi:hypothetical protein
LTKYLVEREPFGDLGQPAADENVHAITRMPMPAPSFATSRPMAPVPDETERLSSKLRDHRARPAALPDLVIHLDCSFRHGHHQSQRVLGHGDGRHAGRVRDPTPLARAAARSTLSVPVPQIEISRRARQCSNTSCREPRRRPNVDDDLAVADPSGELGRARWASGVGSGTSCPSSLRNATLCAITAGSSSGMIILGMKVSILDDYFDTLRTLPCFAKLAPFDVKIWKRSRRRRRRARRAAPGYGSLVLIRERTKMQAPLSGAAFQAYTRRSSASAVSDPHIDIERLVQSVA